MLNGYEEALGSTWPFFADVGWSLAPYFSKDGLPLMILLDTATMEIVHLSVGHESGTIKDKVLSIVGP